MSTMKITAYADKVSVAPGETINFMVNCNAREFRADIVKLICGDMNPDGPGYQEKVCRTHASGSYKGRKQVIHAGSFVEVPHSDRLNDIQDFTVQAFIWPTTPDKGRQAIVAKWDAAKQRGATLSIAEGNDGIELTLANGKSSVETFTTGKPLLAHEWYFVAASWNAKKKTVTLVQQPAAPLCRDS